MEWLLCADRRQVRMLKDFDADKVATREVKFMKNFGPKYDPLGEGE